MELPLFVPRSINDVVRAAAMKRQVEYYLARARECEDMAEKAADPHIKRQWLQAAQQWRDMAAAEEKSRW